MKKTNRPYSRYTHEALKLLATTIKLARVKKGITTTQLATRAGISRDLLYRIEKGDPSCSIGVTFELCSLLGISLFNANISQLKMHNRLIDETMTLIPKRVSNSPRAIDDDF